MVLLTAKQVLVRISVIILTAEFLIMLFLGAFSDSLNIYLAAALDVLMLAAIASPAIYLCLSQGRRAGRSQGAGFDRPADQNV